MEDYLRVRGSCLAAKAVTLISHGYRPEVNVSAKLGPNKSSYFHSLIGILHWVVKLGRVDINCKVSMISSHLDLLQEGHLQEVFHIFAYLKKYHNAEIVCYTRLHLVLIVICIQLVELVH